MAFDEYNTSPTFSGNGTTATLKRFGTILGSERETFYNSLFPHSIAGIAQLPAQAPGFSALRAKSFSAKPLGEDPLITNSGSCGASTPNTYDRLEVEIEYGVLDEDHGNSDEETGGDPNADPVATLRMSIGGEFLTIPNRGLKWKDSGDFIQGEDITAGKIIPTIERIITLHRATSVPYSTIRGAVGKVNSGSYMGAAAGNMLFLGADVTREITTESPQPWRIEYRFIERGGAYGWNHLYDPDDGTWKEVMTKAGDPIYPEGSFTGLF